MLSTPIRVRVDAHIIQELSINQYGMVTESVVYLSWEASRVMGQHVPIMGCENVSHHQ